MRGCLNLCEQSSDSPKPVSDLPQFLPVVLSITPALAWLANPDSVALRDAPDLSQGPKLYLRFSRFLN